MFNADALIPASGEIGGYQVCDVLQSGGRTIFLRAQSPDGADCLLKVPNREQADDATLARRFEREARILKTLEGPSFPALRASGTYAAGNVSSIPYLVTDMPRGQTLAQILAQESAAGSLPNVDGSIRLLRRLAEVLSQVHSKGIVHRSLRPASIVMAPSGEVQIMDFVLGRGEGTTTLTREHSYLGTARYVAPEQIRQAHAADGRADLYSLGLIIYECVTHQHPFGGPGSSKVEEIMKHLSDEPPPPSWDNPDVPPALDEVLGRLLKVDPDDRYQSAASLLQDLNEKFPALA